MKIRKVVFGLLLAGLFLVNITGVWAGAVRGVTDTEIKLGFLSDFSGPGKYAGPPIAMGAQMYVDYINDKGGVHGRKIKAVIEDNGILPNTTLAAAKKIILKDEVFAIGFNLGSSGSSAILPLCEENKVVLMPHGANKRFYSPGNKWVFVPYSTQFNMAAAATEYILSKEPRARIGIIYQDDDFGQDGVEGARNAAKFMKTQLVKEAPYKIGTIDMSPQMRMMKEANADWILLWTYLPQTGSVLKERRKMGWNVKVLGNNTTSYPLIFPLVGDLAHGYLVVTPITPWNEIPKKAMDIVQKYGNYVKISEPTFPDGLVFGGWAYTAAMVEGLRKAGRDLTPENLVKGLESIKNLDMMGICPNMTFTPERHVGYFSTAVLKGDAKEKKFVVESPIVEPKSPQY